MITERSIAATSGDSCGGARIAGRRPSETPPIGLFKERDYLLHVSDTTHQEAKKHLNELMAGSSEELGEQAATLRELVDQFTVRDPRDENFCVDLLLRQTKREQRSRIPG